MIKLVSSVNTGTLRASVRLLYPLHSLSRALFLPSTRTAVYSTQQQRDAMGHQEKPKVLVLTGPTGVGKTELSLLLAERLDGEIVSADSVQVTEHESSCRTTAHGCQSRSFALPEVLARIQ